MLIGLYQTKTELVQSIGEPLHFAERNLMVSEYSPFGTVAVVGPPGADGHRWFAEVTIIGGRIVRVA